MDLSSASEEDNPSFDVRVEELLQNRTPASTIKVNNWAENKFDTWLETTSFPYLSFEDVDYDRLNYIMERFLFDVGEKLKYRSMHSVITALNRKLKERSLDQDLFVTKRYERFRRVYDGWLKEKQASDISPPTNKAGYITEADEERLWDSGVFGISTPIQLLTTVTFLMCKVFTLRGGDELKQLKSGDITITKLKDRCEVWYRERRSKNKQPGLKSINKERKQVQHFDPINESYSRSFSFVYQVFLSKSHPKVSDPESKLQLLQHCLTLKKFKDLQEAKVWFCNRRVVGKNYPKELFEKAMEEAKIDHKGRNLSLRSIRPSSIHRMAKNNVHPEKMRKRTGHSSISALNQYTR